MMVDMWSAKIRVVHSTYVGLKREDEDELRKSRKVCTIGEFLAFKGYVHSNRTQLSLF